MSGTLYLYINPVNAIAQLTADNGVSIIGIPTTHQNRQDAQQFDIPFDTGGMGSSLRITHDGYAPFDGRAILIAEADEAYLNMDDFRLQPIAVTPPNPTPPPNQGFHGDPEEIINQVYQKTHPDLSTKEGCGKFTEDCCTALHENHSQWWGHIRKNPGQNQYNGHAVDAVMLATGEGSGGYDIIHDSVSPNASPACNYAGPADLELWYYPADGQIVFSVRSRPAGNDPDQKSNKTRKKYQ